jgi:AcrR family transcriptional regulator
VTKDAAPRPGPAPTVVPASQPAPVRGPEPAQAAGGRVGPGRPRSERARLAILAAAADLLVEGGLAAATMEAIATRAAVSKVTIYKWWPTRGAVAVEAYFRRYRPTMLFDDTGDIASELIGQLSLLVEAFRGRAGAVMAELIGQAQTDPIMADMLRTQWIQPRREASTAVFRRAIERGQLRADIDIQAALDQLYGPVYFRLMLRHQPMDDHLPETLVRTLLDGAQPRPDRSDP